MTAAEGSYLGFAKQTLQGSKALAPSLFKYLLFRQGQVGPQGAVLPLDAEIGDGALLRSLVKAGVTVNGAIDFIPRPETLGFFLYGVTGNVTTTKSTTINASHSALKITGSSGIATGSFSVTMTDSMQPSTMDYVVAYATAGVTGTLTITGTADGRVGDTEDIVLSGTTKKFSTKTWTYISGVTYAHSGSTGTVYVGYPSYYKHEFELNIDQFDAPYWTTRFAPGGLWGEEYADCRFNALGLEFRAANFLNGTVGFIGITPTKVSTDSTAYYTSIANDHVFGTSITSFTNKQPTDILGAGEGAFVRLAPSLATSVNVTVTGTVNGVAGVTETVDFSIDSSTPLLTTNVFTALSNITIPADSGKTMDVGYVPANDYGEWDPVAKIDGGPQFLSSTSGSEVTINPGTETALKVLSGAVVATANIPLDEQMYVGSYFPAALDIVSKSFMVNLTVKVEDEELYTQMMYNKGYVGSTNLAQAWVANILKAGFNLVLSSDQYISATVPTQFYSLAVQADGNTGDSSNVYWTASPIGLRAQRQVIMNLTGVVTASSTSPIKFTLYNNRASYS
jgi:hypothetical protein